MIEQDTSGYVYDAATAAKTERFQEAARKLYAMALQVDEIAALLDDRASNCPCCHTSRYLNWPQRSLRMRVAGASERLRELGQTIERRANDREFLEGTAP